MTRHSPTDRRQLQQIVAGLTEGVILVDESQDIIWANEAALTMHGVKALPELGATVDQYRDRFRLQYRNNHKLSRGDYPIERVIAGEAFRAGVVEGTPPDADGPQWVHRVRSLVLTRPTGEPDCLVLILTDVSEQFEAEERFESSFNVNPAPAVICRLADMVYVKVNRGFLHLADLSRDQVIGRPFAEIDLFADADHREDALALVAEGRPVPQWEARLAVADGSRAVIVAGQPIEIDDKPCMMFTFMDLEPRREAERELHEVRRQTQADFEALYIETPVALHALDADGRIVTVSNRWLDLLQFDRQEVTGRPITDFMTSSARALYHGNGSAAPPSGNGSQDVEYQFVKKSGVIADVVVSTRAGPDRQGTLVRTTAVLTDVTDRKHGEERFAKAFTLAPVPMMLNSLDRWEVVDANQAFLTMIRRPVAEVVGRQVDQLGLWVAGSNGAGVGDELRRQGSLRNLDVTAHAADGTTIDCLLSAELVNLQGQCCALVVLQDITDRRPRRPPPPPPAPAGGGPAVRGAGGRHAGHVLVQPERHREARASPPAGSRRTEGSRPRRPDQARDRDPLAPQPGTQGRRDRRRPRAVPQHGAQPRRRHLRQDRRAQPKQRHRLGPGAWRDRTGGTPEAALEVPRKYVCIRRFDVAASYPRAALGPDRTSPDPPAPPRASGRRGSTTSCDIVSQGRPTARWT